MDHTQQVKKILQRIRYASMTTVNEDGSPHNSPLVFLYDQNLQYIFWGSHPKSQHSQNISRTGQAFFVAFDSANGSIGLYIKTIEGRIVKGNDLITALKIHNRFRAEMGKDALDVTYYSGNNPQRMWRAKVKQVWINGYERGDDGRLIRDYKIEIDQQRLSNLWT